MSATRAHIPPPAIGETSLLVYGECVCGWWCACHEGARWPKCPTCERQVMPRRDRAAPPNFWALGFAATLMGEQDAVKACPPTWDGGWERIMDARPDRHFDPATLED